ncbi:MAG: TetR/AcrR family transcriptional regulator [Deltaproteobacteria bacterium]|nr:TetR/AcrR family transcriptional regulator [Deltaproteobacteria bacterium]
MARPRETEKRRDLAHRAIAVLEEKGLGISAEQLSRALEINRTTLLYHFPTYAEIIQTVLGELLAEQAAYVEARVAEHEHPIDKLYARVRAVHGFHHGHERRLVFLTQSLAVTGGHELAEIVKGAADLFAPGRRALAEGIERGIEEGTVHPCDAKAVVTLVRAVIDGLTIQRVTEGIALEASHRFLWEHVLAPLKKSPQKSTRSRER